MMPGTGHNDTGTGENVGMNGMHQMSPFLFTRKTGFFVLFREANIQSTGGFVAAILVSAVFALVATLLSQAMRMAENKSLISGNAASKSVAAIMHGVRLLLHYVLMLIVMTMNLWIILAVVIGTSIGWLIYAFIFGPHLAASPDAVQKTALGCAHD